MNVFKKCIIGTLMLVGLAACNQNGSNTPGNTTGATAEPGAAQEAGKQIDQAVDQAGNKIEQAGNKIENAADQAGNKIEQKTDEAKQKADEAAKNTANTVDDATITTKVKAAIFAEPSLSSLQINVETVNGVVKLNGTVESDKDRTRANEIAGAVQDVKSVENNIVVKSAK